MRRFASFTLSCLFASVMAVAGVGGAKAFVSSSPDPFPAGSGFVQSPGCLTSGVLSGLCASGVTGLILSSSSKLVGGNQDFVLDERITGEISFEGAPIGVFWALGDLDLTLFGRTTVFQTGTFDGMVNSEDFAGTFDGAPVVFTLDPSETSTVQVTITVSPNAAALFLIDSSFDLFSQISIEDGAPIPIGGFPITGVAVVPEPPTGVLLALPMFVLGFVRWRAKA